MPLAGLQDCSARRLLYSWEVRLPVTAVAWLEGPALAVVHQNDQEAFLTLFGSSAEVLFLPFNELPLQLVEDTASILGQLCMSAPSPGLQVEREHLRLPGCLLPQACRHEHQAALKVYRNSFAATSYGLLLLSTQGQKFAFFISASLGPQHALAGAPPYK